MRSSPRAPAHRVALLALLLSLPVLACRSPSSETDGGDPPPEKDPARVAVPEIQGAGHWSPWADSTVVTAGVVTAVDSVRFYLQDPAGDGDPATSDAVRVAPGSTSVPAPGDSVRVTGTVRERVPGAPDSENLSVTVIEASGVQVLSAGADLPRAVRLGTGGRVPPEVRVIGDDELPVDLADPEEAEANPFDPAEEGIDFYESLESMRVAVASPVTVSPTELFGDEEGSVWTLVEGGAHVTPDDARTAAGGIRLQPHPDNRGDHNPERVQVQFDRHLYPGGAPPVLAVGSRLGDVTGVVGYSFGNFAVNATREVEAEPSGLSPGETGLEGGPERVTVATYNVLNLNPLPENEERMERLGRQIAVGLAGPDVVALQEIQDENGTRGGDENRETDATATLRALAEAVEAAGGPSYEFFDVAPEPNASGGVPGGNIRNAYLYDPDRVSRVAATSLTPAVLREAGARDPEAFEGSRNPLAATFSFDGRRFTVVNNHFSSRYGSTPVFGALHPFVQAAEEAREAQSRAVNDWVDALLAEDPDARVAVVGDLNTFEFTDDLRRMLPGSDGERVLTSLIRDLPRDERYTYIFQGNSQVLDHVFVSQSLTDRARVEAVHLNSNLPSVRGTASDHDPVVASLRIP